MRPHLSLATRRTLGGLLIATGMAYSALLVATFFQTTAPHALGPDLNELDRLLFRVSRPVSPMERRLEASDTPLGTGPLISSPLTGDTAGRSASMRFAFTSESSKHPQSSEYSQPLSAVELAEREGERLALMDWIRSGASQINYERDDYALMNVAANIAISPAFLCDAASAAGARRVRIRSLINERCVSCHHENGDDTAHLIPFDSYQSIARYLVPEAPGDGGRVWLLAALAAPFPLAAAAGSAFAFTRHSLALRRAILSLTVAALVIVAACWSVGAPFTFVLLAAAAVASICVCLQTVGSAVELLGIQPEGSFGCPPSGPALTR